MNTVIAQRYAHALVELGKEHGLLDQIVDQFKQIVEVYKTSKALRHVLMHPGFSLATRQAIVREVAERLQCHRFVRHALLVLVERHRVPLLPTLVGCLETLCDQSKGIVRAEVTSAAPLSEDYRKRLAHQLEQRTGKTLAVKYREDPSLLAGVITRIGHTMYDGSLRTRLERLQHSFMNR